MVIDCDWGPDGSLADEKAVSPKFDASMVFREIDAAGS
jgi:hypothetical protein